ncbi:MAG: hypothetical protein ACXWLM_07445 [Myxococcales bacterium]
MRAFVLCLLAAACGGASVEPVDATGDDLTVAATIGPQSLTHGTLTAAQPQLAYAFTGKAGDGIAPDAWPTGRSALTPTLALLGPRSSSGHRTLLATGAPRGPDARHPAIDGFHLPKTGSYLVVVGVVAGGRAGKFSLRLWMQSSHLPRQEGSQVDLNLTPSAAATAALQGHEASPHPWTDAEVDSVIAGMQQQVDLRVSFSDAEYLLSALANEQATDAQRGRGRAAVAALIGTPRHFARLDPHLQTFALWWLGGADALLFTNAARAVVVPQGIDDAVKQLIAAWPGAKEVPAGRTVEAKVLNGSVYGWQVEWQAALADADGTQVWIDWAREWFDPAGNWLLEQSPGASEPDDD